MKLEDNQIQALQYYQFKYNAHPQRTAEMARAFKLVAEYVLDERSPSKKSVKKIVSLNDRRPSVKDQLKELRKYEPVFSKKRLNKYVYKDVFVEGGRSKPTHRLTTECYIFCMMILEDAVVRFGIDRVSSQLNFWDEVLPEVDSVLNSKEEMVIWLSAYHFTTVEGTIWQHPPFLTTNLSKNDPRNSLIDYFDDYCEDLFDEIWNAIDDYYDWVNICKRPRNFSLPKLDNRYKPYKVKLDNKYYFYNTADSKE